MPELKTKILKESKVMNSSIFKAYDVRGVYPTDFDEKSAYAIAQGYAKMLAPKTVVVGRDVRPSSESLQESVISGLLDYGVNVVDIGLISTEELYFAVGFYGYDGGIMVTASHNPREFNGMKLVKKGAEAFAGDEIKKTLRAEAEGFSAEPQLGSTRGTLVEKNVQQDFRKFVLKFIDVKKLKPLRVVANTNFGYQGILAQMVTKDLPIEWVFLNGTPDGSFPKGRPDPLLPENRTEFLEMVKREKPDFGVAWDADADRVFFATGEGQFIEAYYMNALLSDLMLERHSGATVVCDPRYTWAIEDVAKKRGGKVAQSLAGHSFIKKKMRETGAVFGGELSGHTFFKDFFIADTGIVPFLLVAELVSKTGKTLSELVKPYMEGRFISGEINFKVADQEKSIQKVRDAFVGRGKIEEFDKVTIEDGRNWRFNVRGSNTESLLRLNIEAKSPEIVEKLKQELVELLKEVKNG